MTEPPRWWTVRAAQNRKPATYRCPFCDELLPALSEQVLVTPEGDARRRRHAHTACALGRAPGRPAARPRRVAADPTGTNQPQVRPVREVLQIAAMPEQQFPQMAQKA